MEEVENVVLTREAAVKENVLPTGRKVGAHQIRGTNLYEVKYVDSISGNIPYPYSGKYTSLRYAEDQAKRYVNDLWDISDKASKKKALPLNQNAVSR